MVKGALNAFYLFVAFGSSQEIMASYSCIYILCRHSYSTTREEETATLSTSSGTSTDVRCVPDGVHVCISYYCYLHHRHTFWTVDTPWDFPYDFIHDLRKASYIVSCMYSNPVIRSFIVDRRQRILHPPPPPPRVVYTWNGDIRGFQVICELQKLREIEIFFWIFGFVVLLTRRAWCVL